ncbi:MAG: MBL fold metallo-hydrolase [Campylobacterota bacterium]
MQRSQVLYEDKVHKCIMFSIDSEEVGESFLSVNQFLLIQGGSAVLIDPGSDAGFEELKEEIESYITLDKIKYIFFSHQDPDVASAITQWSIATDAKIIISKLWVRFLSHYGFMDYNRLVALEDSGAKIDFGHDYLKFVPAHFLHSPGNFSLYDSRSKILFSGDIGAAIVSQKALDETSVKEFDHHKEALHPFHSRYMASNKACRLWTSRVKKLDVSMIAPQHGACMSGAHVQLFLQWLQELSCGTDLMD